MIDISKYTTYTNLLTIINILIVVRFMERLDSKRTIYRARNLVVSDKLIGN